MASQFNESFHSQIFAMLGNPGCATCHGNHEIVETGDELLGLEEGAVCSRCHSESSTGGRAATEMRGLIDSLRVEVFRADSILSRAEHAGMEVSQAQFDLNSATTSLVSARTAVHSFSAENVREEVEAGLQVTAQAYARGQDAMDELQFRRIGLAVSVSVLLLLIVGLVLKIRQLESKPE
jgi:predicted CXXCH cytochrome family protein